MRHRLTNDRILKMRIICFFNQITLFFFALGFITSCNAQDSTSLQKDNTTVSKRIKEKHPMIVRTQGTRVCNIFCAFMDKSGNLWFGTAGEGVYRYDGESFTNYTTKDGLNSNGVSCIIQDKAGHILIGGKGINRYDPDAIEAGGKSFIDITQNTVLSGSSIYTMLEDKQGRLWVSDYRDGSPRNAGYRGGVYLYDRSAEQEGGESFTNFISIDGLKNDDGLGLFLVNEILEDPVGNIWFAGQDREGVVRYDGKSLMPFREEVGLSDDVYRSMFLDKKGTLWLGTHGRGVLCSVPQEERKGKKILPGRKASFINISGNTGLKNSVVMSMIEDKNGDLWYCTDGQGVWRYDGTSFKNFTTEDGLINNSVFSVIEDKEGNLWFGTRKVGLCRYDGKSFVHFSEQ